MAIDDPSALRMFFRSLLPNFNPAEPLADGDAAALVDGAAGGAGAELGGADLRHSVHNLLDAMRWIQISIHLEIHEVRVAICRFEVKTLDR